MEHLAYFVSHYGKEIKMERSGNSKIFLNKRGVTKFLWHSLNFFMNSKLCCFSEMHQNFFGVV